MTLLETIRYNRNDRANDRRLWIISITVITGFFLIVLTLKFMSMLIVLGIILLEIKLMSEKDGEIEIYTEGGDYYLSQIKDKKNELIIEKIRSQEFSWNYYHMVDGKGGTTNQTTHINFLQIKCEIILETGKELKIMRELNQWESVKAGWKYKLLEVNDESEILITTNTLEKLKQLVEGNTPIKAEGVYAADMKNGQI